MPEPSTPAGPLSGLRVVNLSTSTVGSFAGQVLSDFGAEHILIEPAGGHPMRSQPGWPVLTRGSRSIEADLHDPAMSAAVADLAAGADVVLETFRPGVAERFGLGYEDLSSRNPRLVYASVTGFGRTGPLSRLKAYEGVVMAKIGGYDQFKVLVDRPGPAFPAVPYCSISAAQLILHGILAALYERENSGVGQRVDTTLVQGVAAHDVFNWMVRLISRRYSGAFTEVPPVDPATQVPNGWMSYALLVALSADGHWLQFSQATRKLFRPFLRTLGLDGPEWEGAWEDEDIDRRRKFRELALQAVRSRTLAEWQDVFDAEPDVFAEVFRSDQELLYHPQLLHDGQVVEIDEPGLGRVRQSGPLVAMAGTPGRAERPSPGLDADRALLTEKHGLGATSPDGSGAGAGPQAAPTATGDQPSMPLTGVTVLELGTFVAGPFGASLLSDLGARVIKIEQHDGDPIRWQLPMPEIGAIKVLLGKESVAIDINRSEGQDLVREIAKRSDLVLMTFRAGVAARVGLDEASLRAVNPDIVYHSSPGFGVDGPYAHRPAYAPTIGAGSGLARRNIGSAVAEGPDLTADQVKRGAVRLGAANLTMAHADGFSGLAVATGLLLGLLARARGLGGQSTRTSMLTTMSHVLAEDMVEYAGRGPAPTPDSGLHGLCAVYRLYQALDGWVFLAAPTDQEWRAFVSAAGRADLGGDPRFTSAESRAANDAELVAVLAELFRTRPASAWEEVMSAADVACVEVVKGPSHAVLMDDDGLGRALGMVVDVPHLIFESHSRLGPLINFSRSAVQAGPAPVIGQHTDAVLREFGVSDDRIDELRTSGVIL